MPSFVYFAALYIVVLDANVLFPVSLRDTLLRAYKKGLYTMRPFEIEAQHPDDFLAQLFYLYPDAMVEIIERQAKDLQRPPKTTLELLSTLNQHVPNFVSLVRASIM